MDTSFLHTICRVFQRRHEALSREVLSNVGTGIGINVFVKVVIFTFIMICDNWHEHLCNRHKQQQQ